MTHSKQLQKHIYGFIVKAAPALETSSHFSTVYAGIQNVASI